MAEPHAVAHAGPSLPLPLALTMGEPAGIGPEITIAAWMRRREAALAPFVVYACPAVLRARAERMGVNLAIAEIAVPGEAVRHFESRLPVVPIPTAVPTEPGRPAPANAMATINAIEAATRAVVRSEAAALVTNPIAKSVLYTAGFEHPGHTEFLAALARMLVPGEPHHPVMMLASDSLRVVPATIHIPLSEVPRSLTRPLLALTIRATHDALRRDFGIADPRIAISGLNPHAGERGALGREEEDLIAPVIAAARDSGLNVTGPHAADTLFHRAARAGYDAAVCMYHDQALIPLKTLAFDTGVNVTLGLPFVRTSPDHGTAFDIAPQCSASPLSLIAALKLADEIAQRRMARPV